MLPVGEAARCGDLIGPVTQPPKGARQACAMEISATPSSHDSSGGVPFDTDAVSALGGFIGRLRRILSIPWVWEARFRGAEIQGAVEFLGRPILTLAPSSSLVLAGGNVLASSPRCNPLGNFQPCVLRTLAPGGAARAGAEGRPERCCVVFAPARRS